MPVKIKGNTYYSTGEAARRAGISKSTLLRWLEQRIIKDMPYRDRRGWRIFTESDIRKLEEEAAKISR